MFFVYILKSEKDNNKYIGCTHDLKARLQEHNKGRVTSTKDRKPLRLIYYEAYSSEKDAWKRESNLKLRKRSYSQLMKRIDSSLND